MDAITNEIVQHLSNLSFSRKKVILELLKTQTTDKGPMESYNEIWKKELLTISAWTDADIDAIYEARKFINQWTPPTVLLDTSF